MSDSCNDIHLPGEVESAAPWGARGEGERRRGNELGGRVVPEGSRSRVYFG